MEVRRLTARKEEIYRELLGERTPLVPDGARQLIDILGKHQVLHCENVFSCMCLGWQDLLCN